MRSISKSNFHVDGWTPTIDSVQEVERGFLVDPSQAMKPCGCGVKIDLNQIVYPVLRSIAQNSNGPLPGFGVRNDAGHFRGRLRNHTRRICSPSYELCGLESALTDILSTGRPHLIVELFSSPYNFYREYDALLDHFNSSQIHMHARVREILRKFDSNKGADRLVFAKGHSIQGEKDFFLLDLLDVDPSEGDADAGNYVVCNNDTIITADSVLMSSCPISVFIALNNALNDILLSGANGQFRIYPVYDGGPSQIAQFRSAFETYKSFICSRGIDAEIIDQGPLSLGACLIGATVVGSTDREPASFDRLTPGQELILTHDLGDLALLSAHRALYATGGGEVSFRPMRYRILQKMMTPHFLMGRIMRDFLPRVGEPFDPERHVTFASDVSGPGLSILDEAVKSSGVDVMIEDIRFCDNGVLDFPRRNYTSSTNGPWILSAMPKVARAVLDEFHRIGLTEAHHFGRVLPASAGPHVAVAELLRRRFKNAGHKFDVFDRNVQVRTGKGTRDISCPMFQTRIKP